MTSNTYIKFLKLLEDPRQLRVLAKQIEEDELNLRGITSNDFLIRSAFVSLCSAWERYNEDLLL